MAQVGSRGGRISILGLWQPQVSFEYALVQGGFKTKRYIEVMDWIAAKAQNMNSRISIGKPLTKLLLTRTLRFWLRQNLLNLKD